MQAHIGTDAAQPAAPTYARDVAPILNARCVSCHRPNQIGPMVLTSYTDARPWARSIRRKVVAREMPPWGADPRYGRFKNDWSLSQAQIDTIAAWVDAGAPMGDAEDLPPPPTFDDERWERGPPDAVIEIPEQNVAATGELDPPSFIVRNPFMRDVWIQGSQVLPGNRRVVHHVSPHVVQLPAGAVVKDDRKAYWPDGRPLRRSDFQILLSVPKFDFNWQLIYELETPIQLPAGSRLRAIAHYDNSTRNRYNPAPDKAVAWSQQSTERCSVRRCGSPTTTST